jgi:hypothetical protein
MKTKTSFSFCASRNPESIHTRFLKAVIVCILLYSMTPVYAGTPWLHVEGNQIKDPVGNVVVLRGVSLIDLGFLDDWQGGSFAMIDRLTDQNDPQGSFPGWHTKVVRIPITPADAVTDWPNRFNPANDHFYYGLLRPIVDYCAKKGIYVIIDWHYVADTWDKVPQTSEFWGYMAPKFANDSHVLFELFNEPINFVGTEEENWLSVRNDMQTWVNIVRTHAPRNLILVAGPCWSQMIGPIAANPVDGNNIAYVSHIYPGHWRYPWWYMNHITTCAAAHPVMMTEWGFSQSNDPDPEGFLNGTITGYGQPLMDFIEGLGIGNTAWVASYDWGPPMFWPQPWPPPVGTWDLRCGEGEMGCFVKDTLYARRNDNQPCDTAEVDIDVSPLSHNFGEVELGQPRTLTVSISNTGCGELTVSGASIETDFAITSFPPSSVVIKPNETLDMEVTYTPTILGNNSAVLKINSNDADEPVVEVQLSAVGIPPPPSEQISNILAFFDESVEQGTLQGVLYGCGKGPPHADFQLKILRCMIQAASNSIERERYRQACEQLRHIYKCCDGQCKPPDLVTGDAVPELASMIQQLMRTLDCE